MWTMLKVKNDLMNNTDNAVSMDLKLINTEADFWRALKRLEEIINVIPGAPEGTVKGNALQS